VYIPGGVYDEVETVIVELQESIHGQSALQLLGSKEAEAPDGRPEAEKLTLINLEHFLEAVTVLPAVEPPGDTEAEPGPESENV